jgi:hypothetical protein
MTQMLCIRPWFVPKCSEVGQYAENYISSCGLAAHERFSAIAQDQLNMYLDEFLKRGVS